MKAKDLVAQVQDLLAPARRPPDEPAAGGAEDAAIAELAHRLG